MMCYVYISSVRMRFQRYILLVLLNVLPPLCCQNHEQNASTLYFCPLLRNHNMILLLEIAVSALLIMHMMLFSTWPAMPSLARPAQKIRQIFMSHTGNVMEAQSVVQKLFAPELCGWHMIQQRLKCGGCTHMYTHIFMSLV